MPQALLPSTSTKPPAPATSGPCPLSSTCTGEIQVQAVTDLPQTPLQLPNGLRVSTTAHNGPFFIQEQYCFS